MSSRRTQISFVVAAVFCLTFIIGITTNCNSTTETKTETVKITQSKQLQTKRSREYIVTVKKGSGDALLSQVFSEFLIEKMHGISDRLYLIKLKNDPGLNVLKQRISNNDKIVRIQPNYIYRKVLQKTIRFKKAH